MMQSDTPSVNEPFEGRRTSDIGHRIEELRAELARLSDQVQSYVLNRADDVRQSAAETTAEIEGLVRDHPLPVLGVAFGAGFVLGLLLRGGASERKELPRLSRRDFERLASTMRNAFETRSSPRIHVAPANNGDAAFLERLAGALSGLIQASRSTVAAVGSAGERAAKSAAATGVRTARAVADRLSHAAG